jgi:hypothetical protein
MYNLRYHIASLVAVFLALAVGLLLGTVVAERGMITDQTSSLVGDLQQRFDEITATNELLKVGIERDRAFAEVTAPLLTAGQLAGGHIAVLVAPGGADGAEAVTDAIAGAGGTAFVASITTAALGLDKAEPEGLAGYFQLRGVEMAKPGEALERQVAEALVAEWREGAAYPLTELLVGSGLLGIESTSGTSTVTAVVVMGTAEPGCDPFALEVARAMDTSGGVTCAAETAPVQGGASAVFAGERFSAVDHVKTPQGQLSLVWLLAGRAEGYYGSGPGAKAFFPELSQ